MAGVEGEAAGAVQESVAQALGFAACELAGQAQGLGVKEQVLVEQHEFEPDGVGVEVAERDGCCFYVKAKLPRGMLQWMVVAVGEVAAGAPLVVCSSRQTRARWRLRQRTASRRLLPSACLRAR